MSLAMPVAEGRTIKRPAFEVATIKPYEDGAPFPGGGPIGITVSPDGVAWRFARVEFCLGRAYDIAVA